MFDLDSVFEVFDFDFDASWEALVFYLKLILDQSTNGIIELNVPLIEVASAPLQAS